MSIVVVVVVPMRPMKMTIIICTGRGRIDPLYPAAFGVLRPDQAHIRQLFFPRIVQVNADDIVPPGGDAERGPDLLRREPGTDEVGNEEDDCPPLHHPHHELQRPRRLGARALREVFGTIIKRLEFDPAASGLLQERDGQQVLQITMDVVEEARPIKHGSE